MRGCSRLGKRVESLTERFWNSDGTRNKHHVKSDLPLNYRLSKPRALDVYVRSYTTAMLESNTPPQCWNRTFFLAKLAIYNRGKQQPGQKYNGHDKPTIPSMSSTRTAKNKKSHEKRKRTSILKSGSIYSHPILFFLLLDLWKN